MIDIKLIRENPDLVKENIKKKFQDHKLVLVDEVKDLDEATIVGSKTYVKGVIQEFLSLSNGGGLKITIEEYYTPNRTKINGVGITPDVEIELETSVTGLPTDTNDTQLNKAKEILHQQ